MNVKWLDFSVMEAIDLARELPLECRDRYLDMRFAGESHNIAAVLATRSFPGVRGTDSEFMKGTHCQDTQYDQMRYEAAQARGVDTNGKRYLSSLARFPNDPEAWVSGLSDVRRVVTERNWNCTGAFEHQGFVFDKTNRPEDTAIAPEIVEQHVQACQRAFDPRERTPELIEDIRNEVTQELSGAVNLTPEPRVSDYDDPFSLPGMEPE